MKLTIPAANLLSVISLACLVASCGGSGESDSSTTESNPTPPVVTESTALVDSPVNINNESVLQACFAENGILETTNSDLISEVTRLQNENQLLRGEIAALTSGTQGVDTTAGELTDATTGQSESEEFTGPDFTGIEPSCDDANFRIRTNVVTSTILNNARNASDYIAGDSEADIKRKVGEPDRIRSTNSGAFYQFEYAGGSVRFYGAIYDEIAPHIVGTVFDWQVSSCP